MILLNISFDKLSALIDCPLLLMKHLSPIEVLNIPLCKDKGIEVFIKRDDLIHPIISGNKWRKLQENLAVAKRQGKRGIISFGGAFSNHIHALAYACQQANLDSIGIIRGEVEYQSNYTLSWAKHWGMQLEFVDRQSYRQRHEADYLTQLQHTYPNYFIVPEGGTNALALSGVGQLMQEINEQVAVDTIMLPVGSGGTLSGVINANKAKHKVIGIAVLKQAHYLNSTISELAPNATPESWQLMTEFHRGGYAKFSEQDCHRLTELIEQTGVPFEPIYSGKMLLALLDLVAQDIFTRGQRILLIHTGGLQGVAGLIARKLVPDCYVKAIQSHLPSVPLVR